MMQSIEETKDKQWGENWEKKEKEPREFHDAIANDALRKFVDNNGDAAA